VSDLTPAEQRAIDVLRDAGVRDVPVSVDAIASSLGVDLTYEAYDGEVSGMIYRFDDHAVIGVNSTHAPTRQRFTVAHEIGHYVMHAGQPMFVDRFAARVNWRNGASNPEEIDANQFAAELLMPREFVAREVERAMKKRRTIDARVLAAQLAKTFEVSTQAMEFRLANLGVLDPLALVS
jgi:Zn-dependent peptidase ImmA (M78 family)